MYPNKYKVLPCPEAAWQVSHFTLTSTYPNCEGESQSDVSFEKKGWLAEEKKRAEKQKTKELEKQIQQEREEEELNELAGVRKKGD